MEDLNYTGALNVFLTQDQINDFYSHFVDDGVDLKSELNFNPFGNVVNQYVCIHSEDEEYLESFKWNGEALERVPKFQPLRSEFSGKIKPRNVQQTLAIDMLLDERSTVKFLTGRFGTGKTMFMCAAAIQLMEKGKYDKIMWIRNNIEVKNSKPIGHLPGDYFEKLLPFAMPLADHLGGKDGLLKMVEQGKIEIEHLGFIRGRDIKNTIIICSEAENMTVEHIQLLLGRVGEGSALWLDGDVKQVDANVFVESNGLLKSVNRLKGHSKFGYVKLLKTERSETAAMADLLD